MSDTELPKQRKNRCIKPKLRNGPCHLFYYKKWNINYIKHDNKVIRYVSKCKRRYSNWNLINE
jgi:hypothetical protein